MASPKFRVKQRIGRPVRETVPLSKTDFDATLAGEGISLTYERREIGQWNEHRALIVNGQQVYLQSKGERGTDWDWVLERARKAHAGESL
jgi:hypothetical protein